MSSPSGNRPKVSASHLAEHQSAGRRALLQPAGGDLIRVGSRRWFLQTGISGIAGLSLADVLRSRARANGAHPSNRKSVILFWLSGGPSHLDFWDPKPEAPVETRGPFETIATKLPGVRFCEHLPLQASLLDRLTVIRSVDCRDSDDHRAAVMQTGNSRALKDLKPTFAGPLHGRFPSMGSLAAKFRGANDPDMPPFVGLADPAPSLWHSDVWNAGELGSAYEPIAETGLAGRLEMPPGVNVTRAQDRDGLRRQFDRLRHDLDASRTMERMDQYDRQALEMVLSGKAREAFQLDRESDSTREFYGRDSFGEKALLARRLVEAGVTFVVVSGRFGVFDNHGDDVIWGGLIKGLKPLFPSVDRSLFALVSDLESRGLLESTLILTMGEFGRSPMISTTGGRTHWTNCMSVLAAGGKGRGGQIIGSTDAKGYDIKDGRVIPADLAATVFRHLDIDLDTQWTDLQGRPHPIVSDGGRPIAELW
ncbi:MAG TPA: DUF1501 domain-containing protein [Planctomycetaceae bacterium]|nr:DUF1501 domain-containing protein [Planctomycetaceae bacterium]